MVSDGFIDLHTVIAIAWSGWHLEREVYPETHFSHAVGFAIQEAGAQHQSWKTGRSNDNNGTA